MESFLHLLARDLLLRQQPFDRVSVIFPNKRAGLFLARELAGMIDRPTWMPAILSMEEFAGRYAGARRADEITLVIKLYHAYRACSRSRETFDDFYFWGNMLLEDFNDVDKYLVNAKDLFSNLHALREIERAFPYLTNEQVAVVRRFWSHFREGACSPEQQSFLQTWDSIYPTYLRFRENLLREGLCYEGMGERLFCERLDAVPAGERLVFAGFNALNRCEEKIFRYFRDNGQAAFYWDHDTYYSANEAHEAGLYIRENLKHFPNALGTEHFNNFRHHARRVEHVAVSSKVGQAKLLPALLDEFSPAARVETAVVLCDESLLLPVIHSIPPSVEKINITMGYPARNTATVALLALAAELQRYARREAGECYYYYKPVVALLNHPLLQAVDEGEEARHLTHRVHAGNLVHVPAAMLQFNPLARVVFSPVEACTFDYFLDILSALIPASDHVPPIEKEVLFTLYKQLQQARDTFREEDVVPGEKMHARIVERMTRKLTVPFSGEPLEGIQVMGLLETRVLDFKKLVILSANEGIIPKNETLASFIPYNLRVGFGLPTPTHRDAIYAYHFYRLIQRADEIKILHADTPRGAGEMSRFLYQLKYESGIPARERYLHDDVSARVVPPVVIRGNEAIARLLQRYSCKGQGISPSALNLYLDCRLKFYFRYLAGLRETGQPTGELDQRLLGNIFHEVARRLYATFPGGLATAERLEALEQDDDALERLVRDVHREMYDPAIAPLVTGHAGDLALPVVKKYARKLLAYDRTIAPFTVLSLEQPCGLPVTTAGGSRVVYIEGSIDRVDRVNDRVRVIDYKTGVDRPDFKSVDSLFDPDNKQRNKAAFQTLLYCMMYAHEQPGDGAPLLPALYSTRALFTPRHDYHFLLDGVPVQDVASLLPAFRERLARLFDELFSPDHLFAPASHDDKCHACPYNAICSRVS